MANAQDSNTCHALYAERGDSLFAAADCYQTLNPADYEATFVALAAAVNDFKSKPQEQKAIEAGLSLVNKLEIVNGKSAEFYYWRACFVSFQSQRKDRGNTIPRATLSTLKSIQVDLNTAFKLNPLVHSSGPQRVLGLIHVELPRILGGDRVLAEKNLAAAVAASPRFSANWTSYARALLATDKKSEAKEVLQRFLELSDEELNPYPEAARFPRVETEQDRKLARQLLDQL